jgi:hypothetical protein
MDILSDVDKRMIDMAGKFRYGGAQLVDAVRAEFGMGPTAFCQRVNVLIETREALAWAPLVVGRLRRLRGARHGAQARR